MNYAELLQAARGQMGPCRACPVCNGRACGGNIPGPGAKGSGTVAMHPNEGVVWSRERVYPKLGFERSVFLPEYENTDQIRRYVSDQANYTQVLRVLEEGTGPQFLFNVTI